MADQQPQQGANDQPTMPIPVTAPANGHHEQARAQTPGTAAGGDMSPALGAFWEAVKRLPAYIKLAAGMARDPEVPKQAKTVLGVGGGYAVSPIDLVPGIIPVAGQMDDLYVMLTALQQAVKMTPAQVADRHLGNAGLTRDDIETDLKAVRELVRVAVIASVKFGGKTLGRLSRAATRIARDQLRRRDARRPEKPA